MRSGGFLTQAAKYSAIDALRDGRRIEFRALKPDDWDELGEAVGRVSAESLRGRFFREKSRFTEQEISYFVDVDFVNHVALVATVEEGGRPAIVGSVRYIVIDPGQAEIAFGVADLYHGQGIGAGLMRHLIGIARDAGIKKLVADVLPENIPMLKVFEKSGLPMSARQEDGVTHVVLHL
jgi:RimJ/RimL family protein N-acetyltransferase